MDFDPEEIRTVDVVCRDGEGKPLMSYQLRIDESRIRERRQSVALDVTYEPDYIDDFDSRAAGYLRAIKMPRRSFKLTGPLVGAEFRTGPAVEDAVLCRWDEQAEQFTPVIETRV